MGKTGFAEIQIQTCSGEVNSLAFQRDTWRESRIDANRAISPIYGIALGGKELKQYQDNDQVPWARFFPGDDHVTRVVLYKRNPKSGKGVIYAEREYECQHSKS